MKKLFTAVLLASTFSLGWAKLVKIDVSDFKNQTGAAYWMINGFVQDTGHCSIEAGQDEILTYNHFVKMKHNIDNNLYGGHSFYSKDLPGYDHPYDVPVTLKKTAEFEHYVLYRPRGQGTCPEEQVSRNVTIHWIMDRVANTVIFKRTNDCGYLWNKTSYSDEMICQF